jgi:hypothetical protein
MAADRQICVWPVSFRRPNLAAFARWQRGEAHAAGGFGAARAGRGTRHQAGFVRSSVERNGGRRRRADVLRPRAAAGHWQRFQASGLYLHGGGTGGYSSFVVFDRATKRAAILLSDTALNSTARPRSATRARCGVSTQTASLPSCWRSRSRCLLLSHSPSIAPSLRSTRSKARAKVLAHHAGRRRA